MGFSKKGKRKIIYNEEIFYWFVKRDEDYSTDYLNIIKEDRSLVIFYRVNQISDEFIHPKVFIEKSSRLKTGLYPFFPPLSDEIITPKTVSNILKWHDQCDASVNPVKYQPAGFLLTDIDYKTGKINHIIGDFKHLSEDMLQIEYPGGYILDLGWYGSSNGYIIHIIKNKNWETPVKKIYAGYYSLKEILENAVDFITSLPIENKIKN